MPPIVERGWTCRSANATDVNSIWSEAVAVAKSVGPRLSEMSLDRLMNPQSIAIVGASQRADAIGTRVIRNLRRMGYGGRIHPVNPNYREVEGLSCYPSLSSLPEKVDAAFLAVPAAQGPALVDEAAASGIRAVFINANGYADGDAGGVALQRRIEATVRAHAMMICGPNNLGIVNVQDRAAIWTAGSMTEIKKGPLALISQSGSVAIALAEDERQIGFSYLVTTGNEAGLTVAEYLDYIAHDERVGVILLYLETIRNLQGFAAAAREAVRRGKTIVALKLGKSEGGRALIQAHTGSLAGEDRLYEAFFRNLGIVRVRDLDEMIETAIILVAGADRPFKGGLVAGTLSGGEAAPIADLANAIGLEFPQLVPATLERLRPAFPPYAIIHNPLDAWGLGFNRERFGVVVDALLADPHIGTIAFVVDAPGSGGADVPYARIMAETCVARVPGSDKRFAFINNTSGTGPNREVREILATAGIPYLSGTRTGLTAINHALNVGRSHAVAMTTASPAPALTIRAERDPSCGDVARFRLLAEAGLPMAQCAQVTSAAEAVRIAEQWGYPLVLKGSAPLLPHKSDFGLVRLGLRSAAEVETAYADICGILSQRVEPGLPHEIYLQRMADPGLELILGCRNEPGFGSFVVVGVGGVFVEAIDQASVRVGPVDEIKAMEMLRETPAARLLNGFRGKGPYDAAAAAAAIAALSRLGAANIDTVASLEINPLIVHERGATGVDVVIEAIGFATHNSG